MQPDQDKNEWQQPVEQPSQAPYATPPALEPEHQPVISMAPDQPQPVVETVPVATAPPVEPTQVVEETPPPAAPEPATSQPEEDPVRWQAHEYIHHEKNAGWFVLFAIIVVGLIALAIFVLDSITFAILVPVMAAALLVYTHRPPRLLNYTLSRQGLHINDKLYPFSQFKSFGVIHDGNEYSVMLIPTKRFQPGVSVYFPEESGEAIVDMLGVRLPMQELHLDAVDKIIRKLRI
jgi:hypothetical protein